MTTVHIFSVLRSVGSTGRDVTQALCWWCHTQISGIYEDSNPWPAYPTLTVSEQVVLPPASCPIAHFPGLFFSKCGLTLHPSALMITCPVWSMSASLQAMWSLQWLPAIAHCLSWPGHHAELCPLTSSPATLHSLGIPSLCKHPLVLFIYLSHTPFFNLTRIPC